MTNRKVLDGITVFVIARFSFSDRLCFFRGTDARIDKTNVFFVWCLTTLISESSRAVSDSARSRHDDRRRSSLGSCCRLGKLAKCCLSGLKDRLRFLKKFMLYFVLQAAGSLTPTVSVSLNVSRYWFDIRQLVRFACRPLGIFAFDNSRVCWFCCV